MDLLSVDSDEFADALVSELGVTAGSDWDELIEVADEWGASFPDLVVDSPSGNRLWRTVVQEGRLADVANSARYPVNQLYLLRGVNVPGKGRYVILDSYIPGVEIVSRKNTQFLGPEGVRTETALGYIRELRTKYAVDTRIASTASVPADLADGNITGQLVLEVPVQQFPFVAGDPICVAASAAAGVKVVIRDYVGRVYCT